MKFLEKQNNEECAIMNLQHKIDSIFSPVPEEFTKYLPCKKRSYFLLDGKIQKADSSQTVVSCIYENEKPLVLGETAWMNEEECIPALNAAITSFEKGTWSRATMFERAEKTEDFVSKMREVKNEGVTLEMLEIGKSKKDCEKEFDRTIEYILQTTDAMKQMPKNICEGVMKATLDYKPHGVVLCLGPYNYPLNEAFTTLIPALAMGNSVIAKAPRYGMLCTTPLYSAFAQTFPKGTINLINGDGKTIITPLMKSGKIDVFSFIGGSTAYETILKNHPHVGKLKLNAGLEAKNSAIIFQDANIEECANEILLGALSFNGQRCTAIKRVYVPKKRAEEFVTLFTEKVTNLSIGMPWENPAITPMPHESITVFLKELVEDAVVKGAHITNSEGGRINKSYFHPAVLYPVTKNMRIFYEEQFGPVVPIVPYDDPAEPIQDIMQDTYGQQTSIFTDNSKNIEQVVQKLQNSVSRININTQCMRGPDSFPFTGRKNSAVGVLSITDALQFFSQPFLRSSKMEKEKA